MRKSIDIVIPWVDSNDPAWIREKERYVTSKYDLVGTANYRFQSWDNLQYWFRAIEQYLPWINKIFFITWGHIPEFLKKNHPKLRIVRHDEYIPKVYLPTFNSNTIEMNLHRIEDLSENFILFNDDLFPLQKINEEYYFVDDQICDEAVESVIVPFKGLDMYFVYLYANNMSIINKYFKKRDVIEKNSAKWFFSEYGELLDRNRSLEYWNDFTGFRMPHMANAYKKSVLKHLWEKEHDRLDSASRNKFRYYTDVSNYLVRYWQLCEGGFFPRRTLGKKYNLSIHNYKEAVADIAGQRTQMISISETCTLEEFATLKREINSALAGILPNKSTFEY